MLQNTRTEAVLERLPIYYEYLRKLPSEENVSAPILAKALNLGEVQVRKDLALVSHKGKPKTGYEKSELMADIKNYMGYDQKTKAVLVGLGKLGSALYDYEGFQEFGIEIVQAFDREQTRLTKTMDSFTSYCITEHIEVGIITVDEVHAQEVCDLMATTGIRAIWNFAPVRLNVPDYIIVQNVNMATSLSILIKHMRDQIENQVNL